MILVKTDKCRALLGERRALSPRARQLLVLADGKRSKADLSALLGFKADELVVQLVGDGLLVRAEPDAASQPAVPSASAAPRAHIAPIAPVASIAPTAPRAPVAAPAVPAAPQAEPAGGARPVRSPSLRRSFAGSKMYMVGLTQLMRDADASALAVGLHSAQEPAELRHWLVRAVVYIHSQSGAAYATRVTERLLEVFPEEELAALCDDLVATQLPAVTGVAVAHCPRLANAA